MGHILLTCQYWLKPVPEVQIIFIQSVGYEEPPAGMKLDDGVYYNKYMIGQKIKMSSPLTEDIIEYSDGTKASVDQMAKDVTTFYLGLQNQNLRKDIELV